MAGTDELIRKSVEYSEDVLRRTLDDEEAEAFIGGHTQQRAAIILLLNEILKQQYAMREMIRQTKPCEEHAEGIHSWSFSEDGKQLSVKCRHCELDFRYEKQKAVPS